MAMSQEECCKTVRLSVTVKEVSTNVRWRDEVRHQPGPGGPISQPGKGTSILKRGRRGQCHCVYRWILYRKCRHYTSCSRQVLTWRGGGTRERKPSHSPRLASPLHKNLSRGPKVSRGTRNTTKKKKKKKKSTQDDKKTIIKKGCTLSPLQQQDGQVPQPAEGKVLEPLEAETRS